MQRQALLPRSPSKASFITALLTANIALNPLELKKQTQTGSGLLDPAERLYSAVRGGMGLAWCAILTSPSLHTRPCSVAMGCWKRLARLETLAEELL